MDKALNLPPRLFEPEMVESWGLPTWLPWASDQDILDSVYDTYLWCVPRPRRHLKRPENLDMSLALYELCLKTHRQDLLQYPCPKNPVTVRDICISLMPSLAVLESLPRDHMLAYTCLLLSEFEKAAKIPPDILCSDSFLHSAAELVDMTNSWDVTLRNLVHGLHVLPRRADVGNQYVTYDYWRQNLNVSDEDINELMELVRTYHDNTRLSETDLLARVRIGIVRTTQLSVYFL